MREREREREIRNSSFIHDLRWANQRTAVPTVPTGATQPIPETSDPTSTMRTAVYPPSRIVGDSPTNENSPFQMGLESSRIPGLYKPAVPDQQQDTLTRTFRARSSGSGPRAGIVYPLQPHRRPLIHTSLWMPPFLSQPPSHARPSHPW